MAILDILILPNPILRKKCGPIIRIDQNVVKTARDMIETMYDAPGVGLAATQVGLNIQLAVIDANRKPDEYGKNPLILFNPKIIEKSGSIKHDEGCLSIPGAFEEITRAAKIKVSYTNEKGKETVVEATGLLAQALQHEIDHLNGILYIDHLSSLKRKLVKKKFKKFQDEKE